MTSVWEICLDGTSKEVQVSFDSLDSAKAYCIVDESSRSIFLWKGRDTGVREKFVGARVASKLRGKFGPQFKVRPIDQGDEPPQLLNLIK